MTRRARKLVPCVAAPPLPLTAKVTEPMLSPFCSPLLENCVLPLPKVTVWPYVLLWALAVTVSAAALTVKVPVAYVMV